MLELRDYQNATIEGLREAVRSGHKHIMVCAPTGAGKTEIAIALIQEALGKGSRTAFVVDRLSILYQTEQRFDSHKLSFGVLQSGHPRFIPYEKLQLCSSQTLARRGIDEGLKLIIVDEAHTCYKTTVEFIKRHPDVVAIGLSATPFTKGVGKVYTHVVNTTTTDKLTEQGWLSPVKAYAAKRIDMTGARVKFSGEWDDQDIEDRALVIVGDVVSCWKEKTLLHFNGPVKTLVFSATVAHGTELCRQWQSAGFNFQQISYKDGNDDSRRALIEEFRKPDSEIVGLVSCEVLAKGFDVVDVRCGVSCRPYRKSLSGHIQQLGRVMRPAPGKDFALWIDHSGNFLRFAKDTAKVFANGVSSLDDSDLDNKVRKEPEEKKADNVCKGCGYILSAKDEICPSCGLARPARRNTVEHLPGELEEVTLGKVKKQPEWMKDKQAVWAQIVGYALEIKPDPIKAEKFALAQFRSMYEEWPYRKMANTEPMEPSSEVRKRIRYQMIRYFKGAGRRDKGEEARAA